MNGKVVFLTVALVGNLLLGQTQAKGTDTKKAQGRSYVTAIRLGEDAKMTALPATENASRNSTATFWVAKSSQNRTRSTSSNLGRASLSESCTIRQP